MRFAEISEDLCCREGTGDRKHGSKKKSKSMIVSRSLVLNHVRMAQNSHEGKDRTAVTKSTADKAIGWAT